MSSKTKRENLIRQLSQRDVLKVADVESIFSRDPSSDTIMAMADDLSQCSVSDSISEDEGNLNLNPVESFYMDAHVLATQPAPLAKVQILLACSMSKMQNRIILLYLIPNGQLLTEKIYRNTKGHIRLADQREQRLGRILKSTLRYHHSVLSTKNLVKAGLIQSPDMDLRKQVLSGFRPLRKNRVAIGEPTTAVSAKRMAIGEGSSSERTMTEGNIHCHKVLPSLPHLPNSPPTGDSEVAGTFTLLSRKRGKEVATPGQGGGVSARAWGRMIPHYPPSRML
ncbi:hypothetical protein F0562_024074 [Nyssa sinensis]|uniref:Uncharacterized protein n=1 Tax=Nyssa sinensis TaxID=561372 RepID=A0A5J5BMG9_9ASTE|nr:hypothetical protein F0562_024074 [Nyssa sinensis]